MNNEELEKWFFDNKKITEKGCWEWSGTVSGGYGRLQVNRIRLLAHRYSLELHLKRQIPNDLEVRHMCHNSVCINPLHLQEGSHADNMKDMVDANRQSKGEILSSKLKGIKHPNSNGEKNTKSKLTETQVIDIRKSNLTTKELSNLYKISKNQVLRIKNGISWSYLNNK
jgi:hypothetical protein